MFYHDTNDLIKLLLERSVQELENQLETAIHNKKIATTKKSPDVITSGVDVRIALLETHLGKYKDFYENDHVKHYIICEETDIHMPIEQAIWSNENLGYSPILLKVDSSNIGLRTTKTMLMLFKSEEDIVAFKLRWL